MGALNSTGALLVSPPLMRQYARVLNKPELVSRHHLEPAEQTAYLSDFFLDAEVDAPPRAARNCPDPRDQMLWDLLEANPEAILVTGEHALRRSDHFPGRVFTPREFVERHLDRR